MSKNTTYGGPVPNSHQGIPLPSIPSVDEDEGVTYYNQGGTKSNNSSSNSEDFDITEELEVGDEPCHQSHTIRVKPGNFEHQVNSDRR